MKHLETTETDAEVSRESRNPVSDNTVQVDVGLLDKLMNLVGELVLARNQVLQYSSSRNDPAFTATSQRLNLITSDLQEGVMKTRMQPIGIVWNKFPSIVRDLAAELGKEIDLVMDGSDTELDRTIVEAIKDPLMHLVRNSCDHGIETAGERERKGKPAAGQLKLRAFHEGGHVNIEISDDGQGRGAGMDLVKTNIERIGGSVDLESGDDRPGTTVKIKIPLTLAIMPGLIVSVGGDRFVVPQMNLSELIRLEGDTAHKQIHSVHGVPVYRRRGQLLPLVFLHQVLQCGERNGQDGILNIVVVHAEGQEFGLVVERIDDTQEIVVKPLGKQLKSVTVYSGATIMGDGKAALILDVTGIAQRSLIAARQNRPEPRAQSADSEATAGDTQSLLIFSAGSFGRLAAPLSLVARLEEIPSSRVERAAGDLVVQYRDGILPLIDLAKKLSGSSQLDSSTEGTMQVIVFGMGDRFAGLLVDRILDIVDDRITARHPSRQKFLSESIVIGQKITDCIDLQGILASEGIFEPDVPSDSLENLAAAVEKE